MQLLTCSSDDRKCLKSSLAPTDCGTRYHSDAVIPAIGPCFCCCHWWLVRYKPSMTTAETSCTVPLDAHNRSALANWTHCRNVCLAHE